MLLSSSVVVIYMIMMMMYYYNSLTERVLQSLLLRKEYRHCHWHRRRTAAILYPTFHSLTALKTTATRLRLRPAASSSPSPREDPLLPETMEGPPCYHPSEETAEEQPLLQEDARLTDAEKSRTIVEVVANLYIVNSTSFSA